MNQQNNSFQHATLPGFIAVDLSAGIDQRLPDNEALERKGRIGKIIARNRPRFVCVAAVLFALLSIFLAAMFIVVVVRSLQVRASGLDLSLVENADDSSLVINGRKVEKVVQPVQEMEDTEHAAMLLRDPRYSNYTLLTPDEVRLGYLPWTAAEEHPRVNFTLSYAEGLVRSQTNRNDTTCVCYAAYGLPYNIVYVSSEDEVAYEPRIAQEFDNRVVRVKSECSLNALLEETKRRMSDEKEPLALESGRHHHMTTNSSGIVEYMDSSGVRKRKTFGLPEFPCVKHCISFFQ